MTWNPIRRARHHRETKRLDVDRWRVARRMVDEDVTVLGEQLADLDIGTIGEDVDVETAHHYRRALDDYERANAAARAAATVEDVVRVEQVVANARYHRACVLALRARQPLPERRGPCFFDPRHGPSTHDVLWAPPMGALRSVTVCAADAQRLRGGEPPAIRMVRVGDRYVPSHEAGSVEVVLQSHQGLRHERSTSRNRKNLFEADLNQAINGVNGPGGPFAQP